jgi:hypothetical protein
VRNTNLGKIQNSPLPTWASGAAMYRKITIKVGGTYVA